MYTVYTINNVNTQESTKIVKKYILAPSPEPGRFPMCFSSFFHPHLRAVGHDLRTQWRDSNLKVQSPRFDDSIGLAKCFQWDWHIYLHANHKSNAKLLNVGKNIPVP